MDHLLTWPDLAEQPRVVAELLKSKVDVNLVNANGTTPLYIAAQEGHVEIVAKMLRAEASVNVSMTASGATLLYLAARDGHTEVASALLKNNVSVNIARSGGVTPLHLAANNGFVEVATLLLESGADPGLPRSDGLTLLLKKETWRL
ncbi:Serine/threonine-protein phosphatase 6 regulatory ankyrin repeat subunit, partial [Globisporangium splendens]